MKGSAPELLALVSVFLWISIKKNPLASFGFIGSNTINKSKNIIEDRRETKKFRIYRMAVFNYFGVETFTHFSDPENSVYLAISNKNKSVSKIIIKANKILDKLLA